MIDQTAIETIQQRYRAEWAEKPRPWPSPSRVHILRNEEVIGDYSRNYPHLYNSFYPFVRGDQEYALYSPHYTTSRVMTLPDCRDLCGEDPDSWGFCPVDYYVPYDTRLGFQGEFGFVAGAVWADDQHWKIQYLDLSRIEEGILRREERFGYLPLPEGMRLKDTILLDWAYQDEPNDPKVGLIIVKAFNLKSGQEVGW
jgi:hypothetical protein